METTIFLSKLIGVSTLIMGIALGLRWKKFRDMVVDLIDDKGTFYIVIIIELIVGVALVLSHNLWNGLQQSVVSIFGWLMAFEATLYLIASHSFIERIVKYFNKKSFYVVGSIFYIVVGAYLIYTGFGL